MDLARASERTGISKEQFPQVWQDFLDAIRNSFETASFKSHGNGFPGELVWFDSLGLLQGEIIRYAIHHERDKAEGYLAGIEDLKIQNFARLWKFIAERALFHPTTVVAGRFSIVFFLHDTAGSDASQGESFPVLGWGFSELFDKECILNLEE